MSRAPASTMLWIELVADISAVWRGAGTFPMTAMPASSASMKMVGSVTRAVVAGVSLGELEEAGHALVDDPAVVRDHHARPDLVAEGDGKGARLGPGEQQRADVA